MSVFKSGKYWYFTFQVAERKHRGGGFPTEEGVRKAEAEHRQELGKQAKMEITPDQFLGYLRDYGQMIASEYYDPKGIIEISPLTLGQLAVMYFETKKNEESSEWHVNKMRSFQRQFSDWFDIEVRTIMREDVREHRNRVADEVSNDGANKDLALLKSIYRWGIDEGLVDRNPCQGVKTFDWERRESTSPRIAMSWRSRSTSPQSGNGST